MTKHEETHYCSKGATIYLTKQASKILGFNAINTYSTVHFDQVREMYTIDSRDVPSINGELSTYELSKEAVLLIKHHYEKEEIKHGDFFAQTGATMGSSIKFDSTVGTSSVVHHSEDRVTTQITSPKHGSTVHHSKDGISISVR